MEALPGPLLTDSAPEIDLRRVWATIARSAWLILGCVLLVARRRCRCRAAHGTGVSEHGVDPHRCRRSANGPSAAMYGITDRQHQPHGHGHGGADEPLARQRRRRFARPAPPARSSRDARAQRGDRSWRTWTRAAPLTSSDWFRGARGNGVGPRPVGHGRSASVRSRGVIALPGRRVPAHGQRARDWRRRASSRRVARGRAAIVRARTRGDAAEREREHPHRHVRRQRSRAGARRGRTCLASRFVQKRLEAEKAGARSHVVAAAPAARHARRARWCCARARRDVVPAGEHHIIERGERGGAADVRARSVSPDLRMGYVIDHEAIVASLTQLEATKDPDGHASGIRARALDAGVRPRSRTRSAHRLSSSSGCVAQEDELRAGARAASVRTIPTSG